MTDLTPKALLVQNDLEWVESTHLFKHQPCVQNMVAEIRALREENKQLKDEYKTGTRPYVSIYEKELDEIEKAGPADAPTTSRLVQNLRDLRVINKGQLMAWQIEVDGLAEPIRQANARSAAYRETLLIIGDCMGRAVDDAPNLLKAVQTAQQALTAPDPTAEKLLKRLKLAEGICEARGKIQEHELDELVEDWRLVREDKT